MAFEICGGEGLYLPPSYCDDCGQLEERVRALENLLRGVKRVSIVKSDTDSTQSGYFLGEVNNG